MKQALILDLDNTIYPVSSIARHLFVPLFALLDQNSDTIDVESAKDELQRRPYHLVAEKYNFSPELTQTGLNMLRSIELDVPMQPFDDYQYIKSIPITKFLVTTGFPKLQWSKVKLMGLEDDFAEIHIVDPDTSQQTKKDVFADILKRNNYTANDVLVIGDDPESEIKAAIELGIDTFLFDPEGRHPNAAVTHKATDLKDVLKHTM